MTRSGWIGTDRAGHRVVQLWDGKDIAAVHTLSPDQFRFDRHREQPAPGRFRRVLPEDRPPSVSTALMDLHMLVQFGGKERTETEFRELYERAGIDLSRVVPTSSDVSLVQGVRV